MYKDHKVAYRSYETLMALVMSIREKHAVDHLCLIRIRPIIEHYVTTDRNQKGKPSLVLFDHDAEPHFNRVKFTLNVNSGLWHEAEIGGYGEPLACFKLLHEMAHILLHLHPEYSFSHAEHSQLKYIEDEESAEWQANVFAALFLAPPYLALECPDRKSFLERFNYPAEFVTFWFELRRRRPLRFAPNFCPSCGNQTLASISSRLRCTNCGHTACDL